MNFVLFSEVASKISEVASKKENQKKKKSKVISFQKKGVTVGVGGIDPGNHMN